MSVSGSRAEQRAFLLDIFVPSLASAGRVIWEDVVECTMAEEFGAPPSNFFSISVDNPAVCILLGVSEPGFDTRNNCSALPTTHVVSSSPIAPSCPPVLVVSGIRIHSASHSPLFGQGDATVYPRPTRIVEALPHSPGMQ
ncbi:uncharacterized protein M6B38_320865 [Iris pallida]|uniref:Uncharacterized protein n=1 Tax=Iris pallida TaxID=29817 RepID=A0AAX6HCZ0_IRIPA|nr:uncharacterized protein M6B38_320865 [Iris pallida]